MVESPFSAADACPYPSNAAPRTLRVGLLLRDLRPALQQEEADGGVSLLCGEVEWCQHLPVLRVEGIVYFIKRIHTNTMSDVRSSIQLCFDTRGVDGEDFEMERRVSRSVTF